MVLKQLYMSDTTSQGKVALVTGGDSGIGRSVCYHFALEGATVAFTYVQGIEDRDKDDTLKMLLKAKSSDAEDPIAIATDVSSEEDCKRVVEQVASKYGRIDILVNNAGVQHYTNLVEEITEEWLVRLFRTNIFGYFFMTK
jgi:NAD(P)-dependent dehydrogenase (short-subunit alcohol dehydrogenase family)